MYTLFVRYYLVAGTVTLGSVSSIQSLVEGFGGSGHVGFL